jgi:hypothetical protein
MARRKGGWFGESRRHSMASRGISTGTKRKQRTLRAKRISKASVSPYKEIDGEFQGLVRYGTIMGLTMRDSDGNMQEFYGEPRYLMEAVDGLKKNAAIRVNFASDNDWTIERFDE